MNGTVKGKLSKALKNIAGAIAPVASPTVRAAACVLALALGFAPDAQGYVKGIPYLEPVYKGTDGNPTNGIARWATNTVYNYTVVTSATKRVRWGTAGATSWYVVTNGTFQIEGGVLCAGDVRLVLCDGAKLTATSTYFKAAGIQTVTNGSFTIYETPAPAGAASAPRQVGSLDATGGDDAAGIGSGTANEWKGPGCNITINGGTVTATGGKKGAGIGGGERCAGENIVINGGTVRAKSAGSGAGIGGGYDAEASGITINGGTVIASGNGQVAAIGGANGSGGSNITIREATVYVSSFALYGGGFYTSSSLIGSGYGGVCLDENRIEESARVFFNLTGIYDDDNSAWIEPIAPMPESFEGIVVMTPGTQAMDRVLVDGPHGVRALPAFVLTNAVTGVTSNITVNGQHVDFANTFLKLTDADGDLTLKIGEPTLTIAQQPISENGYTIIASTDGSEGITNYCWCGYGQQVLDFHALTNRLANRDECSFEGTSVLGDADSGLHLSWSEDKLPAGGTFTFTGPSNLFNPALFADIDIGTLTQGTGDTWTFKPKLFVGDEESNYHIMLATDDGSAFAISNLTYEANVYTPVAEGETLTTFPAEKGEAGSNYVCRVTYGHRGTYYTADSDAFTLQESAGNYWAGAYTEAYGGDTSGGANVTNYTAYFCTVETARNLFALSDVGVAALSAYLAGNYEECLKLLAESAGDPAEVIRSGKAAQLTTRSYQDGQYELLANYSVPLSSIGSQYLAMFFYDDGGERAVRVMTNDSEWIADGKAFFSDDTEMSDGEAGAWKAVARRFALDFAAEPADGGAVAFSASGKALETGCTVATNDLVSVAATTNLHWQFRAWAVTNAAGESVALTNADVTVTPNAFYMPQAAVTAKGLFEVAGSYRTELSNAVERAYEEATNKVGQLDRIGETEKSDLLEKLEEQRTNGLEQVSHPTNDTPSKVEESRDSATNGLDRIVRDAQERDTYLPYALTLAAQPTEGGAVAAYTNGEAVTGGRVVPGTNVTVVATPAANWQVAGIEADGVTVSTGAVVDGSGAPIAVTNEFAMPFGNVSVTYAFAVSDMYRKDASNRIETAYDSATNTVQNLPKLTDEKKKEFLDQLEEQKTNGWNRVGEEDNDTPGEIDKVVEETQEKIKKVEQRAKDASVGAYALVCEAKPAKAGTVVACTNGTEVTGGAVVPGTNVTVTVTATNADWQVGTVTTNGGAVAVSDKTAVTFAFAMPSFDVTVAANFVVSDAYRKDASNAVEQAYDEATNKVEQLKNLTKEEKKDILEELDEKRQESLEEIGKEENDTPDKINEKKEEAKKSIEEIRDEAVKTDKFHPYALVSAAEPTAGGTVSVTTNGTGVTGIVLACTPVTLGATAANEKWQFKTWVVTNAAGAVTLTADATVAANGFTMPSNDVWVAGLFTVSDAYRKDASNAVEQAYDEATNKVEQLENLTEEEKKKILDELDEKRQESLEEIGKEENDTPDKIDEKKKEAKKSIEEIRDEAVKTDKFHPYALVSAAEPTAGGTVSVTTNGTGVTGIVLACTPVTLDAAPNGNWQFKAWVVTNAVGAVALTADATVAANGFTMPSNDVWVAGRFTVSDAYRAAASNAVEKAYEEATNKVEQLERLTDEEKKDILEELEKKRKEALEEIGDEKNDTPDKIDKKKEEATDGIEDVSEKAEEQSGDKPYELVVASDFSLQPPFGNITTNGEGEVVSFEFEGEEYFVGTNAFTSFSEAFEDESNVPFATNVHVFGYQTVTTNPTFRTEWRLDLVTYEQEPGVTNESVLTIGTTDRLGEGKTYSRELVDLGEGLDGIGGEGTIVLSVTNGTDGASEYLGELGEKIDDDADISVIYAGVEPERGTETDPDTGDELVTEKIVVDEDTKPEGGEGTSVVPGADTDGTVAVIVKEEVTNDVEVAGKLVSRRRNVVIVNESTNTLTVGAVASECDVIITNLTTTGRILTLDGVIAGENITAMNNGTLVAELHATDDLTILNSSLHTVVGTYRAGQNVLVLGEHGAMSDAHIDAGQRLTFTGTNVVSGPVTLAAGVGIVHRAGSQIAWSVAGDNRRTMIDFGQVSNAGAAVPSSGPSASAEPTFGVLVDEDQSDGDVMGVYTLASNAASAEGKSFSLRGGTVPADTALTVGDVRQKVGEKYFRLYVEGGMLMFEVSRGAYDVTFHAMGGQHSDGLELSTNGCDSLAGYVLPSDPKRDGYTLAGWYVSWSNGVASVTNGQPLVTFAPHALYAQWTSQAPTPKGGLLALADIAGGQPNTTVAKGAYSKNASIGTLVTPLYLTSIGNYAFNGNTALKSVTLTAARSYADLSPVAVSIGRNAFSGCSALEEVRIAAEVSDIGQSAFQNCTHLKKLVFRGDAAIAYGASAFYRCGWQDGSTPFSIYMSSAFQTNNKQLIADIRKWNTTAQIVLKVDVQPIDNVAISGLDLANLSTNRKLAVEVKTSVAGTPDKEAVDVEYTATLSPENWQPLEATKTAHADGTVTVEVTVPNGDQGYLRAVVK